MKQAWAAARRAAYEDRRIAGQEALQTRRAVRAERKRLRSSRRHRHHPRAGAPEIVLLDEPTAGVDVELRKGMWAIIDKMRARGVTIILTTHYIEEAEMMADRVGVINRGKLLMVDEKDAMMARLGRTEAHITLAQPLATLPPEIGRFPVELEAGGTVLRYRGGDGTGKGKAEVAELTKALIGAGIDYVGIDTRESSLEDIFVSLLGEGEVPQ